MGLYDLEAVPEMELACSSHSTPVAYVQEHTAQAKLLCRLVGFDQDAADVHAQHHKTETASLTTQYISNVEYTKRSDTDSVGVHRENVDMEDTDADADADEEYDDGYDRIAQRYANQNYQNDLELILSINTDIEATQVAALQSKQQASRIQSSHMNLQGQRFSNVDGRSPRITSNTESFCNPSWTTQLQQDVLWEPEAAVDFPNGRSQLQYQLPSSFKTKSTSLFSFNDVGSWPLPARCDESVHQPIQSWEVPTTQVSNSVLNTEMNHFPFGSSESYHVAPIHVLPPQISTKNPSSHGSSPSVNSPFEYTSPMNEMMPSQVPSPLPTEERRTQDELLIECRRANISYKDIKEQYGFEQSISTLRGRYRNLTKQRHERVRKPNWTPMDVSEGNLYARKEDG